MFLTMVSKLMILVMIGLTGEVYMERHLFADKFASTSRNEMCINNCYKHKCLVYEGRSLVEKSCNVEGTSPLYFTSQYNDPDRKYCLSQCGRFGKNYEWCYTRNDETWDYCSTAVRGKDSRLTRTSFTSSNGPCKSDCEKSGGTFTCWNYYEVQEQCSPKTKSYWPARTYQGQECISSCKKHDNKAYYWCRLSDKSWNYCASPARSRFN